MMDREDTPWYWTARLFRQSRRGDWEEVFERIADELASTVAREMPEQSLVASWHSHEPLNNQYDALRSFKPSATLSDRYDVTLSRSSGIGASTKR